MISWDSRYEVGVPDIDAQHRKLIEIASEAYSLLTHEYRLDKYDEIVSIIEELRDYTKFHFEFEEKLLQSRGYKKLFTHIMEHREFIEKVESVELNKVDHDQNAYLQDIVKFVVDWIVNHILEKDKAALNS